MNITSSRRKLNMAMLT